MPVDRPTFSESWYRVAQLSPRLRSSVQIHRQYFRGQMWHVIQDPANNQFFRLNEAAYRFVALLDGRRNVAQTWQICNEQLGDNAPTQGEAIQLLGQLYSSNLLQAELAPDAEGLFNRYKKRVGREVRGYLMNLLFIRIPILDPDRFLNAWVGIIGRIFTWYGFVIWLALLCVGACFALSNVKELTDQFDKIFAQEHLAANLALMYVSFAIIKTIHEFGHAFACKKFGVATGSGGEVHVMGIMFLVLTPVPYVDASSSWAFRQKWHRFIVGGAGMIVEMAVASIAAVIWARTMNDPTVHALAYNAMVIGSVTTLLFNGNPLLRYDGYYMLSDLLEIPNLAQRSKDYVYYLVKRYVWGVKNPRNPAHTTGEKAWFLFYGIASTIYRTIVVVAILYFIAGKLFVLGMLLALAASIAWLCVPIGKFIHYLATNGELMRVRSRAVGSVLAFVLVVGGFIYKVPWPDRFHIEGVVRPVQQADIFVKQDGFVDDFLPSGTPVRANDQLLIDASNPELEMKAREAQAELNITLTSLRKAQASNFWAAAQHLALAAAIKQELLGYAKKNCADLRLRSPIDGTWVGMESGTGSKDVLRLDQLRGRYITGQRMVGTVLGDEKSIVAVAPQELAPRLQEAGADADVEIRVEGRPDLFYKGKIQLIHGAGSKELPSPSLSLTAGGMTPTNPKDPHGMQAKEEYVEVHIDRLQTAAKDASLSKLFTGQRVIVCIDLPPRSLLQQWCLKIRQMIARKSQECNSQQ